jgi:hypothetical protein
MMTGDRVKLNGVTAKTMSKLSRGSHKVDWCKRRGTIAEVRKNGTCGIRWDGRSSLDYYAPRALVKGDK